MANAEHLDLINLGAASWNDWREKNPDLVPDLEAASFGLGQKQWGPEYGGPINLAGARLRHSDLRFATLIDSELSGADLAGAKLFDARLSGADLRDADLSGARFDDADVRNAQFDRAKLYGADLSGVRNLTSDQIAAAQLDETTRLPDNVSRPRKVEDKKRAPKLPRTEQAEPARTAETKPVEPGKVDGGKSEAPRPKEKLRSALGQVKAKPALSAILEPSPEPTPATRAYHARYLLPAALVLLAGLVVGLAYWPPDGDAPSRLPADDVARNPNPPPNESLTQRPQGGSAGQLSPDGAAWSRVVAAGTREALQSYLADHPNGSHVAEAEARLEALILAAANAAADRQSEADLAAWGRAEAIATPEALRIYLADHPEGQHAGEARQQLALFGAKAMFRPVPNRPPVRSRNGATTASPSKPPAADRAPEPRTTASRRAPGGGRQRIQASDVLSDGL